MRNKKQLKDILNSLPLNLTFEDVGVIAKRFGLDPISSVISGRIFAIT